MLLMSVSTLPSSDDSSHEKKYVYSIGSVASEDGAIFCSSYSACSNYHPIYALVVSIKLKRFEKFVFKSLNLLSSDIFC